METASNGSISAFPANSAVLVFEQGSPELRRVQAADDLVYAVQGILDDLRKATKYGDMIPGEFDFRELLGMGITAGTIRSVVDAVRSGIFKSLAEKNINIETL